MLLKILRRCYFLKLRRCFSLVILFCALVLIMKQRKNSDNNQIRCKKYKRTPYPAELYILRSIHKYNSKERIQNINTYGNLKKNAPILVVFIDNCSKNFHIFLDSLSKVRGINEALVIFSHSYYDESMNLIVGDIHFCRVLQIFYPYSVQSHSLDFPGRHPCDCLSEISIKVAQLTNCTGAYSPDLRGRYRDPIRAEGKHHWWWTANQVFEKLNTTKKHTGLFIFLEDDFFLMPDFIYMALYMKNVGGSLPQCEFLSMGTDSIPHTKADNVYEVGLSTWDPKIHSSVLAFDVATWNTIVSHYDLYCDFDDASWSRSLNYISFNRKNGMRFKVLWSYLPRAIRISYDGYFGIYRYIKSSYIEDLYRFENKNEGHWFPIQLKLYVDVDLEPDEDLCFDYSDIAGGWSDPRDIALCHNMTLSKMKRVLMEMQHDFISRVRV